MLKKVIVSCLVLIFLLSCFFVFSSETMAEFGLENFSNDSDNTLFSANQSIPVTITRIISIIIGIVGMLLVVLLVYGGILYATSAGNDDQADKGKKVLTYSIIGIIVVAASFILTNYVIVGLFSDEDEWQAYTSQNSGGGSGGTGGGSVNMGQDDNQILSEELLQEAEVLVQEGEDMVRRGGELRERGQRLIDEGDESAGRILLDDGTELINNGNERIEEGNAILDKNQTTQRDNDENNRNTGPAAVDLDCKWIGEPCYLGGRVGQDCCSELECGGGIADSGLLWGACDRVE